jgi:hypothetical protein
MSPTVAATANVSQFREPGRRAAFGSILDGPAPARALTEQTPPKRSSPTRPSLAHSEPQVHGYVQQARKARCIPWLASPPEPVAAAFHRAPLAATDSRSPPWCCPRYGSVGSGLSFSLSRSASTIISINCSKSTCGFQPSFA